ncbi:Class II histone deacetylase complex subunits 2 and 3 [Fragilaria crotonensis]|nr:Class II histone deacetylase complex subunits 2 and 3 [Fragilaria crotonensis]
MKLINKFVEDYPDVSVRQVTMKFSDVTTKDCPPGVMPPEKKSGRAFQFYLRPKFYAYLGPDDSKPDNWEKMMAEDDVIYAKEQEQKKLERKAKDQQLKEMISETTSVKSGTSDAADFHGDGDDDGDETEDETAEAEPFRKKVRYE